MNTVGAVFIDRDGTLVEERSYLADPEQVALLPGVVRALESIRDVGLPVVVVTNQSGIARGLYTLGDYHAVAARLHEMLEAAGVAPALVEFCPHHPDFSGPCDCRKPGTGMYRRAAEKLNIDLQRSFYVGDKPSDVAATETLGGRGILVRTGYGRESEQGVGASIQVVEDLEGAADLILASVDPSGAPE